MVLLGKVSNGTVILPSDAHLPEGAEVEVRPVETKGESAARMAVWHFPEGRHLGGFRGGAEDWRLLANEPGA